MTPPITRRLEALENKDMASTLVDHVALVQFVSPGRVGAEPQRIANTTSGSVWRRCANESAQAFRERVTAAALGEPRAPGSAVRLFAWPDGGEPATPIEKTERQ